MNSPRRTEIGPKAREGTRLVWARLRRTGQTPSDLARALTAHTSRPTSAATLHAWLYGVKVPSDLNKIAIEEVLEVPRGTWLRAPSRPIVVGLG